MRPWAASDLLGYAVRDWLTGIGTGERVCTPGRPSIPLGHI